MDQQKIEKLLTELDALVPKEGAKVVLRQYGGGADEGEIRANPAGYLRMGLELMKGAFVAPRDPKNPHSIWINLTEIISESSSINFDVFERSPEAEEIKYSFTFKHKLIGYAVGALVIAVPVLAIVGAVSLVMMVLR